MRITKLDPYNVDDPKNKNRNTMNSQQKVSNVISKKKIFLTNNNLEQMSALKISNSNQNEEQYTTINNEMLRSQNSPLTHSKKAITNQILFKDEKQTLLEFLQMQIKNQGKDQGKAQSKNKIKLPLIVNNKIVSTNFFTNEQSGVRIAPDSQKNFSNKNINQSSNSNYQKQQSKGTAQNFRTNKQNPIFINIKAVTPIQKIAIQKKKDHSMRDLRILRRQKQENDFIVEQSGSTNEYSRGKITSGLLRKTKLGQRQSSPLKLTTAQKIRSQRNSIQKITSAGNRQKKSFSINQKKKNYSVTYSDFCVFISSLNKIRLSPPSIVLYKAFVGKGNNSILVKTAIKNRFWWNIMTQKIDQDVNFLWLQSRDNDFINNLVSSKNNLKIQTMSQKQIKKQKYHLQNKGQEKLNQNVKQFVHSGFSKLISQKQIKQNNYTPYYAQTLTPESLTDVYQANKIQIHNHFQFNWNLTNKKALFYNLKTYYELIKQDPFKYIPLTFHIKQVGDKSWDQFKGVYQQKIKQIGGVVKQVGKKKKKQKKQKAVGPLWIIKPGENSNQGCGIQVSDNIEQIIQIVKEKTATGKNRSSIIQKYLMPFLYNKRKFDIRCYMLTTSIKGVIKGYWYEEGYIRTSSKQFTTKNLKNRMIHLTNDAVQKKGEDYGKYQNGNKISFGDFQKYLDNNYPDKKLNFYKLVYPQMMRLARDALTATCQVLDGNKRQFTFEIFGLDFMIDEEFNTWLIEVNNNPCLQLSSPLLARIIPNMIENAFKIAIDPLFPPPSSIPKTKALVTDLFESNKYTLIFNSAQIEEGFQNSISQNKVNLDKIIQGQQEDDQIVDDEEQMCDIGLRNSQSPSTNQKKIIVTGQKLVQQSQKAPENIQQTVYSDHYDEKPINLIEE